MEPNLSSGETMSEGSDMPPDGEAPKQIMLPPDIFPKGMMPKPGDKLVLGKPDEQGMIPCTVEAAPEQNDDNEKADWEQGLREAMSPQTGQQEAA